MTSYTLKEFEALLPAFEEELLHSKETLEGKERENILIIATLLYQLQPISSFFSCLSKTLSTSIDTRHSFWHFSTENECLDPFS